MSDGSGLLNYTKKNNDDVGLHPSIAETKSLLSRTVSRLEYKPDAFYFHKGAESLKELLAIPQRNLSWEDCCFQRAEELLRLNKEKYYIAYSGGIDSTAILVAILQVWPKAALDKVVVLLSKTSIEENPSFFNSVISRFKVQNSLQNFSHLLRDREALLVTGEMGDQLFGSVTLMKPCMEFGDGFLKRHYIEAASMMFEAMQARLGRTIRTTAFERFHPIVEESPVPIKTVFDFFWWFNFSQKWQFVKYRFLQSGDWDLQVRYGEHVLHFYDSIAFQHWSLRNHDLKIRETWDSYKFTNKEFIYKFTHDPEQLKLRKVQSLLKTFTFNEKRMAVTSDYRSIDSIEELRRYVRH